MDDITTRYAKLREKYTTKKASLHAAETVCSVGYSLHITIAESDVLILSRNLNGFVSSQLRRWRSYQQEPVNPYRESGSLAPKMTWKEAWKPLLLLL